jgi:MFS family permease
MMLIVTASFFRCHFWFFAWRFAAGCAGGVLMVAGTSAALEQIPPKRRGLAAGIVIGGVGAGIIASGTLVPWGAFGGVVWTGHTVSGPYRRRLAPVAAAATCADPTAMLPELLLRKT